MRVSWGFASVLALLLAATCAGAAPAAKTSKQVHGSPYLLVWAGDERRERPDFLAVVDVNPSSPRYGQIIKRMPVRGSGMMPHHTEYEFPASGVLFANAWAGGHTFIIDAGKAASPQVKSDFVLAGGYGFPHSFVRLPNGHVLATFQSHGAAYAPPGGLLELDENGAVVRSASAATPELKDDQVWPYSMAVVPALDRVVVSNTPMGMPKWAKAPEGSWSSERLDAIVTKQVQIWRLSDLKLLHTLELPPSGQGHQNEFPAEPRLLPDGSVYVNTFSCGLYRVVDLGTAAPRVEFVRIFPGSMQEMCGVPVIVGKYWIQTVGALPGLIALDISDPAKPAEASRLQFDHSFHMPHWIAADRNGHRLVVTGNDQSWVLIVNLDPQTGTMSVDEKFHEPGATTPGLRFTTADQPKSGPALVHGSLFAPK